MNRLCDICKATIHNAGACPDCGNQTPKLAQLIEISKIECAAKACVKAAEIAMSAAAAAATAANAARKVTIYHTMLHLQNNAYLMSRHWYQAAMTALMIGDDKSYNLYTTLCMWSFDKWQYWKDKIDATKI